MTLIELIVSVLMALFMAAALLFVYAGMRSSYQAQTRLADLQDTQRVALTLLSATIEQSGYYVDPLNTTKATALPAATLTWPNSLGSISYLAEQYIVGTGDGSGSAEQSDAISLRFQSANNDGLLSCSGGTNTSGVPMVFINTLSINAGNELTCSVNNGAPVALTGNVGKMEILYATDTLSTAQAATQPDAYLPASVVTAQSLWGRVRSVKVRLFFMDTSVTPPVMFTNPVMQMINVQNTL